jgi:hypothetical protein
VATVRLFCIDFEYMAGPWSPVPPLVRLSLRKRAKHRHWGLRGAKVAVVRVFQRHVLLFESCIPLTFQRYDSY